MNKYLPENCRFFQGCSRNFCPLDLELELRSGKKEDKCRYMKEPRAVKIGKRQFVSGGTIMDDTLLNLTPESNLKELNEASKRRWGEIRKN